MNEPYLTLEVLMERYVDGDLDAYEVLHDTIRPRIAASLARWLRTEDRIEDALQVTLLRIHASRGRYKKGAPVLPWVMTIARHVAIDHLRARERRKESPLELDISGQEPAEEGARTPARDPTNVQKVPPRDLEPQSQDDSQGWTDTDEGAVILAVREAIESLPESAREVIRLHKLEDRSMDEVAMILGIKSGTARVRAHRGYKALARLLVPFRKAQGLDQK